MKYKIRQEIKSESELFGYLARNRVIYFVPLGKVMPCRFFLSWSWLSSKKFIQHAQNGNFRYCVKYEDISRDRIRKVLKESKEIKESFSKTAHV
jgi:hypothetical protein